MLMLSDLKTVAFLKANSSVLAVAMLFFASGVRGRVWYRNTGKICDRQKSRSSIDLGRPFLEGARD